MNIQRFKIYWSLVYKKPLYLLNAFLAAILTNYLLTLQPGLLKIFIREATKGEDTEHLFKIAYFMIAALFLAFIFDTIEVTTSMLFRVNIEKKLRLIHYKYSIKRELKDISFPLQQGILGLTKFTLLSSLDLYVSLTNIVIVLYFIFTSDPIIGGIVALIVLILVIFSIPTIRGLGKISKNNEKLKTSCLQTFSKTDVPSYNDKLIKMQREEVKRFKNDTILVLSNFLIFKITPTIILFSYIYQKSTDFGELASLFLYFGLLFKPYKKLMKIIRHSTLFFTQAELFKDDIEHAIKTDEVLSSIPKGLVCILVNGPVQQKYNFDELRKSSQKELVFYQVTDNTNIHHSDFVLTRDYKLTSTAKFLWAKKNEAI